MARPRASGRGRGPGRVARGDHFDRSRSARCSRSRPRRRSPGGSGSARWCSTTTSGTRPCWPRRSPPSRCSAPDVWTSGSAPGGWMPTTAVSGIAREQAGRRVDRLTGTVELRGSCSRPADRSPHRPRPRGPRTRTATAARHGVRGGHRREGRLGADGGRGARARAAPDGVLGRGHRAPARGRGAPHRRAGVWRSPPSSSWTRRTRSSGPPGGCASGSASCASGGASARSPPMRPTCPPSCRFSRR